MRTEIERHFKTVLNRPEILNRIGDNIVVFDFIRARDRGSDPAWNGPMALWATSQRARA